MTARWLPIILLAGHASAQTPMKVDSETISGLGARNIGSAAMSGRIAAVAAVQEGPRLTVYVGAASGGVWKSVNGGTTFKPVFDKQPVQSIGAITIDPKNPKVIWVGTGEAWMRNSVSIGDDERSDSGGRRCAGRAPTHRLCRRGERRRLEIGQWRHDLQAGVRQATGPVHRRHHDRSEEPESDLGRHRGSLDAQQRLDRRR